MSLTTSGRIWDEASSPDGARLARRYEADWRNTREHHPEPRDYLPGDPDRRPAALLDLLRIDLALRWEARERVFVEWYRDRYPELGGESLVALLYEEYCLREDAGEGPEAAEYETRFPEVAASFREVLDIHGLFRQGQPPTSRAPGLSSTPLPEVGQTIAGYRLVEELGRGAFARVFRAEERQLADRPVALKVTRTGSREPQTLARLQHTHIVPVYSYRTDPATGLHLLCMPYLGGVTLAQVLADPTIRDVHSGADLTAVLERLLPPDGTLAGLPVRQSALARRTYAQAIAWWGARLAEALQHAHDRGVLHRDLKPSNILVTGDGLPMLLDFNLAQEPWSDAVGVAPAALGGTLAYMAPEHLEALVEGVVDQIDARSDLYALGVVLFDCLVRGSRVFAVPSTAMNMSEAMLRAAEARRTGVPRLRDTHPDVPPALEAVVRRCLAPDPGDRYASAAELATDLQAVADDGPLRFTREPQPSRSIRWLRRHRRRLAAAALLLLALSVSSLALVGAQLAKLRLEAEVNHWLNEGRHSIQEDHPDSAVSHFATAARLAESDERLRGLRDLAREEGRRARQAKEIRDKVEALFALGERLRFYLYGFVGDPRTACRWVESALGGFGVFHDPDWMRRPPIALLDEPRRVRLLNEVNELLFLWVVALDRDQTGNPAVARQAVRICDAALAFAKPNGPWRALRDRQGALLAGKPPPPGALAPPTTEDSARACFQWALLSDLDGRAEATIAWLERATRLEPSDYWSQFYLGFFLERAGHIQRALEHYQAAVALRPHSPWAWYNRALLHQARGDWDQALGDLNRALAAARGFEFLEARLNLGVVKLVLGDTAGARAAFDSVIASAAGGPLARAGRLNRAKLDVAAGVVDRAWAEYDLLLTEDPHDSLARLGRALLALRLGLVARAEADLTILLWDDPVNADEILARRALARLALDRPLEAEADAADAYRRKPSPSRERLWVRALLALARVEDLLWLTNPEDLAVLPGGGPSLTADLRTAAERLRPGAGGVGMPSALAHRTRAVLLSALGDPAAEAEASRAIALAPQSADAYLVRSRVRRRSGDRREALADIESGLTLEPGHPHLLELRGLLEAETGHPRMALIDLNRAIIRGARGAVRSSRARTLMALGREAAALEDWSFALADDPEDPLLYLGRARTLIRLRFWDRALADLEQAADLAVDNAKLWTRIACTYAACLPARPDRFPRWLAHARRAWSVWTATAMPHRDR